MRTFDHAPSRRLSSWVVTLLCIGLLQIELPAREPDHWEETIQQFEAMDAKKAPPKGDVLLIGGSNARRWKDVTLQPPSEPKRIN